MHIGTSPHLGGAELVSIYLLEAQQKMGHTMAFFSFGTGTTHDRAAATGAAVYLGRSSEGRANESKQQYRKDIANRLIESVRDFKPDVLISHAPISNLICHKSAKKLTCPWIAVIHGSWRLFGYAPITVKKPYLRYFYMLRHAIGYYVTAKSAAKVISVSHALRKDLISVGITEDKIETVHNGIPEIKKIVSREAARDHYAVKPDEIVLGALGYFAPIKGFDILIESFAEIAKKYPRVKLHIGGGDVLGDSAFRELLERLIEKFHLSGQVTLLGKISDADQFFCHLDIFVMSSRSEGLPLSVAEAMQYGLPCVVTSAGGCAEMARPDLEGLRFNSEDKADLAAQLERMIQSPELRAKLGKASLERAKSYFNVERCASEHTELYKLVASTNHN